MILKSVLIVLEARLQQKTPLRYANTTHINDSLSFAEDLALPHYPPECQDSWPPSILHKRLTEGRQRITTTAKAVSIIIIRFSRSMAFVAHKKFCLLACSVLLGSRFRLVFASQKKQVKQCPDNLHLSHRRRLYS